MRYHYDEEDLKHLKPHQLHALENNELFRVGEMFHELTPEDEKIYRQYAREHFTHDTELESIWHPCLVNECIKIINEHYNEEIQF